MSIVVNIDRYSPYRESLVRVQKVLVRVQKDLKTMKFEDCFIKPVSICPPGCCNLTTRSFLNITVGPRE